MRDPKTHAWLYLVVGLLAIVSGAYFLFIDYGAGGSGFTIFDWLLAGMGVVGIYRGVKGLRELSGPKPPTDPKAK
jgi:hypothetical protein